MKEDFLQYIWANALFKQKEFIAISGEVVEILRPGELNRDAGPDFFNARIRINGMEWAGNIELHCCNSDWFRHAHHQDAAYDNVILSVVYKADCIIYNSRKQEIPTIVLQDIERLYAEYQYLKADHRTSFICRKEMLKVNETYFRLTLQTLAIERLERKCREIRLMLDQTHQDWEECFYRLICRYWAGNVNAEPFQQLAIRLPYRLLLRYADKTETLEALLLGVAGLLENAKEEEYVCRLKQEFAYLKNKHQFSMMPPQQWKFMRVRPDAFPTLRLALLAAFLQKLNTLLSSLLEANRLSDIDSLLDVQVSEYWEIHYRPGHLASRKKHALGRQIKNNLIINVLVPFMFLYGQERGEERYQEKALKLLEDAKPEDNYIIKAWKKWGITVQSALQTQALIQLSKEYCACHRCLQCRIGREILKSVL